MEPTTDWLLSSWDLDVPQERRSASV